MAIRATGRISRIFVVRRGVNVQLDIDPEFHAGGSGGYFVLDNEHSNFNAIYSLLLSAAVNRYVVTIRIAGDGEISQEENAGIGHVNVDW